jgi:hypothetical protein
MENKFNMVIPQITKKQYDVTFSCNNKEFLEKLNALMQQFYNEYDREIKIEDGAYTINTNNEAGFAGFIEQLTNKCTEVKYLKNE